MTFHEMMQFEAKKRESVSNNTYCGQCGDIIKQECPTWCWLLIKIVTLGFGNPNPPLYYTCKCDAEFFSKFDDILNKTNF